MKRSLAALLAICLVVSAKAETTRLYGKAPQFAGFNINVETTADYISGLSQVIGVLHIDESGAFSDTIELTSTRQVFMDLGALRATAILRQGAEYEVIMPPYTPRPDAERFNPFFKPEEVELGLANDSSNVNRALRDYLSAFDDHYHMSIVNLVRSRNKAKAETLIAFSDSIAQAQNCTDTFFTRYVANQNTYIYSMPQLRNVRAVACERFANQPIEYDIPTYWKAFNTVFQDFMSSYTRSAHGKKLRNELQNKQVTFASLREAMMHDTLFSDTLFCETLLLKGLYDAAYSGFLPEKKVDSLLTTAYHTAYYAHSQEIANNILKKRTHLKAGSAAPNFTLLDVKGKEVSLQKYKGKFLYLAFLHTQNYQCQKDLSSLQGVAKKYKRDMNVVGIFTDEDSDLLEEFFRKKKLNWQPLSFTAQQSVVLNYQVQSLPTYYLIFPDGNIAVPNAPGPEEKIEQVVAREMQKYKSIELQKRRGTNGVRSIYDMVRDPIGNQR